MFGQCYCMCTCICLLQHKLRYVNFEALCTPTKLRNHIPCVCRYNCKALLQSTQKADYKVLLFWGLHRVEKTNGPTPAKLLLHFHCCHCQLIVPVNKPAILQLQSTGTDSWLLLASNKGERWLLPSWYTSHTEIGLEKSINNGICSSSINKCTSCENHADSFSNLLQLAHPFFHFLHHDLNN